MQVLINMHIYALMFFKFNKIINLKRGNVQYDISDIYFTDIMTDRWYEVMYVPQC